MARKISAHASGAVASLNLAAIDPQRDRPHGKRMLKMRLRVRDGIAGIIVPGLSGHRVSAGEHVVSVFEGEERLFADIIEPRPEWIEQASETFYTKVAEQVISDMRIQLTDSITIDLLKDLVAGRGVDSATGEALEPDAELARGIAAALATTPRSIEGEFFAAHARNTRPLLSAEVISEPFEEPQTAIRDAETKRQAEMMRNAWGVSPGVAPTDNARDQFIAEQQAQLQAQAQMLTEQQERLNRLEEMATAPADAKQEAAKPKR